MHHRPCVCMFSHVPLFVAPWTIALHAPLSMDFSRQEYWSRLSFPAPGIFPAQRSNLHLLHPLCWQEDSLPLRHLGSHCRLWVERKFVGISQEIQWLKLHASITGGKGSLGQLGEGLGPHGREEFIERIGIKWNACKDLRVILYFVMSTLPLFTEVASKLFIDSIQRHYKYFSSDSYFPYSIKFSHTAKSYILTSGRNDFFFFSSSKFSTSLSKNDSSC